MLPSNFVISSTLKVGVVYKIEAPELIETEEPHYFLVVAISDDDNFLIVSTTQLHKKVEHLKKRGLDLNTLAYITPNDGNGLKKNSYFNCNEYFTIDKNTLVEKVDEGKLSISGNFSEEEYNIIVKSISISSINDIPKFLLKYNG